MIRSETDQLIALLRQGKRLLISDEGDELDSLLSISQRKDGFFDFNKSVSLRYDVVAPVQYNDRVVNEEELREIFADFDYQMALNNLR